MKKIKFVFYLLLGLFILHPAPDVFAEDSALGHVIELAGVVQVQRAKETTWMTAEHLTKIYFGDTVATGDESYGLIKLVDDSIIRVHANSKIVVNTIVSPVEKKRLPMRTAPCW